MYHIYIVTLARFCQYLPILKQNHVLLSPEKVQFMTIIGTFYLNPRLFEISNASENWKKGSWQPTNGLQDKCQGVIGCGHFQPLHVYSDRLNGNVLNFWVNSYCGKIVLKLYNFQFTGENIPLVTTLLVHQALLIYHLRYKQGFPQCIAGFTS